LDLSFCVAAASPWFRSASGTAVKRFEEVEVTMGPEIIEEPERLNCNQVKGATEAVLGWILQLNKPN
jgi:hypothetical protein